MTSARTASSSATPSLPLMASTSARVGCGSCKRPARRGRQRVEPSSHQLFERNRESFSRFEPKLSGAEGACQLEGKEGVAAGQVVEPPERGPRRHEVESRLNQALHGAEAQRREGKALETLARRR